MGNLEDNVYCEPFNKTSELRAYIIQAVAGIHKKIEKKQQEPVKAFTMTV